MSNEESTADEAGKNLRTGDPTPPGTGPTPPGTGPTPPPDIDPKIITLVAEKVYPELKERLKEDAESLAKEEAEKAVKESRKDFITIFGIFASFVVFALGEIQIFRTMENHSEALLFSGVFVSAIIFILGIIFYEPCKKEDEDPWEDYKKANKLIKSWEQYKEADKSKRRYWVTYALRKCRFFAVFLLKRILWFLFTRTNKGLSLFRIGMMVFVVTFLISLHLKWWFLGLNQIEEGQGEPSRTENITMNVDDDIETEEIRLLTNNDLLSMKEVLEGDNMVFDVEGLEKYLSFKQNKGFIVKVNGKVVGFAYAYELVRPDGKIMFYLHSIGLLPIYQER